MDELMSILEELRPDVDFATERQLIDDGTLTSLDVISLVGELNDVFDVGISVEDLVPENFNSAAHMMALIERLQNGD